MVELCIDDASATQSCSWKLLRQAEGVLTTVARRDRQDGGSKRLKTGQCIVKLSAPMLGMRGQTAVQKSHVGTTGPMLLSAFDPLHVL